MYDDGMDIEIIEKKENPLLQRVEVNFRVNHLGAPTPKRAEVKTQLATVLQAQPELVVIEKMASVHGKSETSGIARVYQSEEKMRALEPEYLLKRGVPKEEARKTRSNGFAKLAQDVEMEYFLQITVIACLVANAATPSSRRSEFYFYS